MKRIIALMLFGLVLGLTGCERTAADAAEKPTVVATTTLVGDLITQIAGDRVQLITLMGPGVDPHTYKPSTADIGQLSRAHLILYNGLHLEGKMIELFQDELKDRSVAIAEAVPQDRLLPWTQGQYGAFDPHIWFDVKLWTIAAEAVRDALVKADPANAEAYRANAADLLARLKKLDEEIAAKLATIPKERRVLITSHDAYNYFGKAYDVQVFGLQGISTETEAGLASINNAVDFILKNKVPAIFVESSVSPKTIERVQSDVKARGLDVKIGGELYSDAMGAPGEHPGYDVHTYEGMVRYNVDTLVNALKGAP